MVESDAPTGGLPPDHPNQQRFLRRVPIGPRLRRRRTPLRHDRTLLAVLAAAAAALALETSRYIGQSPAVYWEHLVLGGSLTLGLALLFGRMLGLAGSPVSLALAAWAGLNGAFARDLPPATTLALGAGCGVLTWAALARWSGGRGSAPGNGLAVGTALSLAFAVSPQILSRLYTPASASWRIAVALGIFGLFLGAYSLCLRAGWRLAETPYMLVLLALLVLATPLSVRRLARQPSLPLAPVQSEGPISGPPILLLILDTVRADHLSVYGYYRDTTPNLRRFAERESTAIYPLAFSPETWTLPAHASLFTGVLASTHGAHSGVFGTRQSRAIVSRYTGPTLAEVLQRSGYSTVAIFANPVPSVQRDLQRGFDVYIRPPGPRPPRSLGETLRRRAFPWAMLHAVRPTPDARTINRHVLRTLDECGAASCFVVANYMDAHGPYAPPPWAAGTFAESVTGPPPIRARMDDPPERLRLAEARYDEQLLGLDRHLGELFEELEKRRFLERSWIVITADHGEAFGEHGVVRHGTSIYNEEVRVPLIISPPRGERIHPPAGAVGLLDVTATLAAVASGQPLGIGRDLRREDLPELPVQVEFFGRFDDSGPAILGSLSDSPARAVVAGDWKLVDYGDRVELYRLTDDPQELRDHAPGEPDRIAALFGALPPLQSKSSAAGLDPGEGEELSREEIRALRALGYIE